MDYAFAPGTTGQDGRVRRMFTRRASTTLVPRARGLSTVREFIEHVSTDGSVTRPVGDLLIGAHATDDGAFLFIPMFPGGPGATDFETLESAIANAGNSIAIPDATIGHTPGDPITHSFHIKGCNIGKSRPFLVKLKEALGGNVNATAPKHFHFIYWHSSFGVWEAMEYEFLIIRPDRFPNRAAALTAFQNDANFTRIDGSAIPDADWDAWIPANITRTSNFVENIPMGTTIDSRTTVPVEREFRYRAPSSRTNFSYAIGYPNAAAIPAAEAQRLSDLESALNNDPTFDAAHDFPVYERWGYSSVAEFVAGYDWRFDVDGSDLVCTGRRHSYTVIAPIVDPGSGNLFFNFYPNAGSTHTAITTGLVESDARFFESV